MTARGGLFFAARDRPGEPQPRAEIGVIVDAGLGLVAQAVAEGHVLFELPVVFGVEARRRPG